MANGRRRVRGLVIEESGGRELAPWPRLMASLVPDAAVVSLPRTFGDAVRARGGSVARRDQ